MVKLTKIYTRGGDSGKTSLGTGERVAKHDLRVAAYGSVDEANAVLGVVRLHTTAEADEMLKRIQNDLFDLGADLCCPPKPGEEDMEGALRIIPPQVKRLEDEIDRMNAALQPLSSFILPGGSASSAYLHMARTVVRRSERLVTELAEREHVNETAICYLNRLSDHLFVLARKLNANGKDDVLWIPGDNR